MRVFQRSEKIDGQLICLSFYGILKRISFSVQGFAGIGITDSLTSYRNEESDINFKGSCHNLMRFGVILSLISLFIFFPSISSSLRHAYLGKLITPSDSRLHHYSKGKKHFSSGLLFAQDKGHYLENSKKKIEKNKSELKKKIDKKEPQGVKSDKTPLDFQFKSPKVEDMPNTTWMLVKTIAILMVFLGGLIFVFRFLIKRSRNTLVGQELVHVISNVPVAQGKFLQIVDIAGKIYVLGLTDQNINLITKIDDPAIVNRLKLEGSKIAQDDKKKSFSEQVKIMLGKGNLLLKENLSLGKMNSDNGGSVSHGKKGISKTKDEDRYAFNHDPNKDFLERHKNRLNELRNHDDNQNKIG